MHMVTFSSGTQIFGVSAEQTLEIVRMVEVTSLPSESGKVCGLINYRGELVPVVDVARYFAQQPPAYSLDSVLVVTVYQGQKCALACQDVSDMIEIEPTQIQTYQGLGSDYCASAFHAQGHIFPILNLARITHEIHAVLQT